MNLRNSDSRHRPQYNKVYPRIPCAQNVRADSSPDSRSNGIRDPRTLRDGHDVQEASCAEGLCESHGAEVRVAAPRNEAASTEVRDCLQKDDRSPGVQDCCRRVPAPDGHSREWLKGHCFLFFPAAVPHSLPRVHVRPKTVLDSGPAEAAPHFQRGVPASWPVKAGNSAAGRMTAGPA